jgi:UDP-glucose:glycoprotein glucosyltransferase
LPIELEHEYVLTPSHPSRNIYLFATIGTPAFVEFHQHLRDLASKEVRYVFRHLVPSVSKDMKMNLPGYGVELAIKNLEYVTVDDRKVEGLNLWCI